LQIRLVSEDAHNEAKDLGRIEVLTTRFKLPQLDKLSVEDVVDEADEHVDLRNHDHDQTPLIVVSDDLEEALKNHEDGRQRLS